MFSFFILFCSVLHYAQIYVRPIGKILILINQIDLLIKSIYYLLFFFFVVLFRSTIPQCYFTGTFRELCAFCLFLFKPSFLQLQDMEETMVELEKFDHTQVMVKERENQRVKRDLEWCKDVINSTTPAPTLSPGMYKLT